MKHVLTVLAYLKARLFEKTTWAAVAVGIAGGAALSPPYSWLFIAAGVIGALVPSNSPTP